MDLTFHKEALAECEQKARYFTNIDFPNIAQSFNRAVRALTELVDTIEKFNNPTTVEIEIPEEGGNG